MNQDAPQIPAAEDLYNMLMGKIEPELLTTEIPHLEEKYQGESAGDRKARAARYTKAYQAYDVAYKAYIAELNSKVDSYRKTAMKSAEAVSREGELQELAELEQAFT